MFFSHRKKHLVQIDIIQEIRNDITALIIVMSTMPLIVILLIFRNLHTLHLTVTAIYGIFYIRTLMTKCQLDKVFPESMVASLQIPRKHLIF